MRKRVDAVQPPERALARAWEALEPGAALATTGGETLRVLYPGRPNGGSGPDFLGAVLATARGELRGDVEVHRQTSDWLRHGHGADARYAGVVLHVVGSDDGAKARPPGGTQLPLLELVPGGSGGVEGGALVRFPCVARSSSTGGIEPLAAALAAAGERRFGANVSRLRARLEAGEVPDQVAYEEIATALGYSRNEAPMRELAAAVPLAQVREKSALHAEALLLGAAGLLPSGRHLPARRRRDAYADALERAWGGGEPALRAYRWDCAHVRPENSPVRRVAGLAHLALRWPEDGLVAVLRELVLEGRTPAALAALVQVPCPAGYWQDHWDVGVPVRGVGPAAEAAALVGSARAADVVVNVLLPLAAASGEVDADPALAEAASSAYRSHPPLAENWITRLVRERALLPERGGGNVVRTARLQQGLIAVYEETCRDLRCASCVIGGG